MHRQVQWLDIVFSDIKPVQSVPVQEPVKKLILYYFESTVRILNKAELLWSFIINLFKTVVPQNIDFEFIESGIIDD